MKKLDEVTKNALRPVITSKGLEAALAASTLGKPAKITHVGLTEAPGYPSEEMESLPGESLRLKAEDGTPVSPHQVSVSVLLREENPGLSIHGVGFYLEDGTLFAVYQSPHPLLNHTAGTQMLVAMDVVMGNIPAGSITVEATGANLDLGGFVKITRRVNGKELKEDITLDSSDVNACPLSFAEEIKSNEGADIIGFGSKSVGDELRHLAAAVSVISAASLGQESVVAHGATGDGKTDDSAAFQAAIDALGGPGAVMVPALNFRISKKLFIDSDVSFVLASGAVLDCHVDGMVFSYKNSSTNTIGGYEQAKNVAFVCPSGLATVNLNGSGGEAGPYRGFWSPTHTENLIVSGIVFLNGNKTHIIELNSCKNALIDNCQFIGNYPTEYGGVYGYEAIQIDYSSQSGAPGGPPWDGTPCENIVIRNCVFRGCESGVGSHAVNPQSTRPHVGIQVVGNFIYDCTRPIKCTFWESSVVKDNIIKCPFQRGILIDSCSNLIVSSNVVEWFSSAEWAPPEFWNGNTTGIIVNNYVPNSFKSCNITISDNTIHCGSPDVEGAAYLNSGLYIKLVDDVMISGNTIRMTNSAAIYIEDGVSDCVVSNNSAYSCARGASHVFVYYDQRPDGGVVTFSGNYSDGVGHENNAGRVFDIRVFAHRVRLVGNTFGPDVIRGKMFTSNTLKAPGLSINDMEFIWSNTDDGGVGTIIKLPRSISLYTSIYCMVGSVAPGTFVGLELLPFDRLAGFRVSDYAKLIGTDGQSYRIDVVDEMTLMVSEVGTGLFRQIQAKRV